LPFLVCHKLLRRHRVVVIASHWWSWSFLSQILWACNELTTLQLWNRCSFLRPECAMHILFVHTLNVFPEFRKLIKPFDWFFIDKYRTFDISRLASSRWHSHIDLSLWWAFENIRVNSFPVDFFKLSHSYVVCGFLIILNFTLISTDRWSVVITEGLALISNSTEVAIMD